MPSRHPQLGSDAHHHHRRARALRETVLHALGAGGLMGSTLTIFFTALAGGPIGLAAGLVGGLGLSLTLVVAALALTVTRDAARLQEGERLLRRGLASQGHGHGELLLTQRRLIFAPTSLALSARGWQLDLDALARVDQRGERLRLVDEEGGVHRLHLEDHEPLDWSRALESHAQSALGETRPPGLQNPATREPPIARLPDSTPDVIQKDTTTPTDVRTR